MCILAQYVGRYYAYIVYKKSQLSVNLTNTNNSDEQVSTVMDQNKCKVPRIEYQSMIILCNCKLYVKPWMNYWYISSNNMLSWWPRPVWWILILWLSVVSYHYLVMFKNIYNQKYLCLEPLKTAHSLWVIDPIPLHKNLETFIKPLKPRTHSIHLDLKTLQKIKLDEISRSKDRNHKKNVPELHPLAEDAPSPKKRI